MAEQTSPDNIQCDGQALLRLAQAGRDWLDRHHATVNQLNVFPVPDGDTGTNMLMTMRNAVKEAAGHESNHIGQVAAHIAHGAMMGSRGNSGTILSQLWQGFAHALKDQPVLTAELLVRALREAADTAYRGVIKPVEGTILTVAREAAEEGEAIYEETQDTILILERVITRAKDALARTPQMLPILQKAGVVDSGGSGLVYIMEGMLRHIRGEVIETTVITTEHTEDLAMTLAPEDEEGYGYDVQFILKGEQPLNVGAIRAAIDEMGWSTVVVGTESVIKVHVHVHDPGRPLSYGVSLGTISDIVVENMQEQFHEYVQERSEKSHVAASHAPLPELNMPDLEEDDIGVVSVASGEGIARVFRQLGATELVMGGQTNNPSTQEILDAIQRVPTRSVIMLPNNKNIILAAEQAARLAHNKRVIVIPTRSMPQGISALLPYDPQGDLENVAEAMLQARENVTTGEITTATRSVELNGVRVSEGQIIGLIDGALAVAGENVNQVLQALLHHMYTGDYELVTLYYGNNVQPDEAEQVVNELREMFSELEFELVPGGQAHYHYIVSVE
ncbi:MAG: DAK2 domain-containing protein [Anaerolineae bacterium]|nr:DAK2 domain-containing protein [Anaerolineae bacterium]